MPTLFGSLRLTDGRAFLVARTGDAEREVRGARERLNTERIAGDDVVLENVLVAGRVEGDVLHATDVIELPLRVQGTASMTSSGPRVVSGVGDRELIDAKDFVRTLSRGDTVDVEVRGFARTLRDVHTQTQVRRVIVGTHVDARGPVVRVDLRDDASLFHGTVDLRTRRTADGRFVLESPDGRLVTRSERGSIVRDDDTWGDAGDPEWLRAAVDAHFAGQTTLEFFRDVLGRHSFDGKGGRVEIVVHEHPVFGQAHWNGREVHLGGPSSTRNPIATLDVVAHEIGHALVQHTAGLDHDTFAGAALGEGFADVIGLAVHHYASTRKKTARAFEWRIGAGLDRAAPTRAVRDAEAPRSDGKSVDHVNDLAGVRDPHHAAGVVSHAFRLVALGGAHATSGATVAKGVGVETAARIFVDALSRMRPDSGFRDARNACVEAARRYGDDALRATIEAWEAAGLGTVAFDDARFGEGSDRRFAVGRSGGR